MLQPTYRSRLDILAARGRACILHRAIGMAQISAQHTHTTCDKYRWIIVAFVCVRVSRPLLLLLFDDNNNNDNNNGNDPAKYLHQTHTHIDTYTIEIAKPRFGLALIDSQPEYNLLPLLLLLFRRAHFHVIARVHKLS